MSTKLSRTARMCLLAGLKNGFSNLGFILQNCFQTIKCMFIKKMGSIHLSSLVYQNDMAKYMKNTIMATKYAKVKKLTGANYLHSFHLEEAQHPNCLFHRKNQALTRGRKQNLTMQLKMLKKSS
jgi:hypothetical protein